MSDQSGCERESILETEVNFSLFIPSQNKDGCARWPYGQRARYCCCLTSLKVGENFSGGCWELPVPECQTQLLSEGNTFTRLVFPTYPNKKTYWEQ